MKKNIVKEKTFAFSVRIIQLFQYLQKEKKEFVLSKQLIRAGTSIGALVMESEHAESKADFIHKLAIAQKECNETIYWLELLKMTKYLNVAQFESINNDATEVLKIVTSIIKTAKNKK